MLYKVTRFKSMAECLKEMAPFVRDGRALLTGRPFKKFGDLRPREVWANWLVCAAVNAEKKPERLTISSDPLGGDGILYDVGAEQPFPTEHVMVPRARDGAAVDVTSLILDAIKRKQGKGGAAYSSGKTLVVFIDSGGGAWFPNRVAKALPQPLGFADVWVISLQGVRDGRYAYGVTQLDANAADAPAWVVSIDKDFASWTVTRMQ